LAWQLKACQGANGMLGAHQPGFWCAPFDAVVRTSRGFGAHHLMLWCAPKLQAMRTRIHKIQLQNPVMFEKKANSPPSGP